MQEDQFQFEDPELDPAKEVVVVRAEMEPLVLDTMTKFGDKQEVSMKKGGRGGRGGGGRGREGRGRGGEGEGGEGEGREGRGRK